MAALKVRKFGSHNEVEFFLRGGLRSGALPSSGPVVDETIYGLNGKTLVFTTPAATVTFSVTGGDQAGLSLKDVIAQIQAALGGSYVVGVQNRSLIVTAVTPGVIVLSKNGTANPILGFDTTTDTTTKKYAAPTDAAPRLISIDTFGPSESVLLVTTEE